MPNRSRSFVTAFALLSLAAACAKKENPPPPPPGGAPAGVSVTSIDVGRSLAADKSLADKAGEFRPTDTVYASVATGGSGTATLKAHWTFQDGQTVNESEQTVSPTGPAHTEFHISKPDGWPKGKYKVEVLLNGTSVGSKDFEIK
jgi:hypothetical protein